MILLSLKRFFVKNRKKTAKKLHIRFFLLYLKSFNGRFSGFLIKYLLKLEINTLYLRFIKTTIIIKFR